MKEAWQRTIDLGRCGEVVLHLSENRKRLLLEFRTDADGFDATGLNVFIEALEKVRGKMNR